MQAAIANNTVYLNDLTATRRQGLRQAHGTVKNPIRTPAWRQRIWRIFRDMSRCWWRLAGAGVNDPSYSGGKDAASWLVVLLERAGEAATEE
jgi:hypothetical protein